MKTINDYPVETYTVDTKGIFWFFDGPWAIIDNFATQTPVRIDLGYGEITYPTSEHAFAAAKASSRAGHMEIAEANGPGAAKALGRRIRLRADWDDVKFDVMWRVLNAKFTQRAAALATLLNTSNRLLVEGNYWYDDIWGAIGPRGRTIIAPGETLIGRNALGKMLMEIRDSYFK